MSYYNTTNATNPNLATYHNKASTQDSQIAKIFEGNRERAFGASTVWQMFNEGKHFKAQAPITSIRRSLNTLEKEGIVEKTGNKQTGAFGRLENLYRLKVKVVAGKQAVINF